MTKAQIAKARALADEHRERALDLRVQMAGMSGRLSPIRKRLQEKASLHDRTAAFLDKLQPVATEA